jgi:lysophospholipase L1-like esterase
VPAVPRVLALICLLGLALAPPAAAQEPLAVEVGKVRLAAGAGEGGALLVPVRYPIELAGQRVELRVVLRGAGRRAWRVRGLANAGARRSPERRRGFVFVHGVRLGAKLSGQLRRTLARGRKPRVSAYAAAVLDLNRDGVAEVASDDRSVQRLRRAGRATCAGIPNRRVKPRRQLEVPLPACGSPVRWRLDAPPENGSARIRDGRLIYRPAARFRGTESILLRGRARGGGKVQAPVVLKVATRDGLVVRAIGDSVTAGFGYYDDGSLMSIASLLSCRPSGSRYDDACSSNSTNRSNTATSVAYAPDYGLANNVSWVAQWANEHGVTDFQNLAVTGSEPSSWTPGGQFYETAQRMAAEDPDYVLMTMGANPLLADMLFGIDNMGCAIWADVFGRYAECIEEAFAGVQLRANLATLYRQLLASTDATVYLMQYHLSVPASALLYSSAQVAMMGALLNREIASVAAAVDPLQTQLRVVAPPHFDVGISIAPVYPSTYSCSSLGYLVDGQSVQSSATQDELRVFHPLSFCPSPAGQPPWVISGDTGIHPSAAGYAQMAAQLPPPR